MWTKWRYFLVFWWNKPSKPWKIRYTSYSSLAGQSRYAWCGIWYRLNRWESCQMKGGGLCLSVLTDNIVKEWTESRSVSNFKIYDYKFEKTVAGARPVSYLSNSSFGRRLYNPQQIKPRNPQRITYIQKKWGNIQRQEVIESLYILHPSHYTLKTKMTITYILINGSRRDFSRYINYIHGVIHESKRIKEDNCVNDLWEKVLFDTILTDYFMIVVGIMLA